MLKWILIIQCIFFCFKGKASKVASRSDPDALKVLLSCWSTLRFTGDDMDLCLRIMSGVLHLGNVEFGERDVRHFKEN